MTGHDRHELAERMDQLTEGLARIAQTHSRYVSFFEEDPETFGAGHYVFYLRGDRTARWAIEEQYAGTDWSDPDRLPTSWTWQEQHRRRLPDGSNHWVPVDEGEILSENVQRLIQKAESWAQNARSSWLQKSFFPAPERNAPSGGFSPPPPGL